MSTPTTRWPKQIKYIIGNEACERFSYYGMTGILAGYISGGLLAGGLDKTKDDATFIISMFKSVNYFTPLLGAWLSDKILGRYKTIFWVSLLYCLGHGTLACSDFFGPAGKLNCLFIGLTLIAFGSGGIKPCVSAFMGEQFRPDQSHLMQKAYGAFYWAINFGSFFSFLVVPWVKNHNGYSAAFGVPGILMAVATFIFWRGKKLYVIVPTNREIKHNGFFHVVFTTLFKLRQPGKKFWDCARARFSENEVAAARSVFPILFVFACIPMFWALYDQTGSTWVLQGLQMTRQDLPPFWFITLDGISNWLHGKAGSPFELVNYSFGGEEMQSLNALIVMLLVPLFTLVLYPLMGRFASPLKRMSYGMFLVAISFVMVAWLQKRIEAGEHLSVLLQTWPYVVLTAAEVLVSTTGLEFAFREAAPEMKSLIMSFWLLTTSIGNLFTAALTAALAHWAPAAANAGSASVSSGRFMLFAWMMFGVAILFSLIASTYQYRDKAAAAGR
jgi:POT family proton-dependent oligopeptide transporter